MKKLIIVMLLLTITSLCFSYPKNKAEAEKLIEAFLQSGTYIKLDISLDKKIVTHTQYILKKDVTDIGVSNDQIVIYARWDNVSTRPTAVFVKQDKYDIKLDANNNLIITLVLPTEK